MRKEVEASIRMIKHSFVEGTFVRLNINTGEEIPLTADMCLEPIIKDLEVLEALKRNVGIRLAIQEWANKESKVLPNDRKIVKEWLENDKQ